MRISFSSDFQMNLKYSHKISEKFRVKELKEFRIKIQLIKLSSILVYILLSSIKFKSRSMTIRIISI